MISSNLIDSGEGKKSEHAFWRQKLIFLLSNKTRLCYKHNILRFETVTRVIFHNQNLRQI